ncbi:protein artemis isoform X3 [Ooceraea biroi]|uniref:protein artemis isoform X3 n=1 Tax=Ooceraea biroi TaxID=2015173 RepID=UPI000F07C282|nr:protein artemis isoform X3 [Ooceraea biroi]
MSSFCGLMMEIPGISVDCFDGENLNSSVYFLSHYHTDHMRGLDHNFFLEHLYRRDKYIYCSPISKLFLEARFNTTNIRAIPINEKVPVRYKHNDCDNDVLVTCISAGHCPGSIMFLFEKRDSGSILYTGDFRINPLDYKKIGPLHFYEGDKKLRKEITAMYLDTTFFTPDYASLPTRKESVDVMCKAVTEWLNENSRNVVILECSALYGSEFLYMELSKSLNMCIHVKDRVYKSYCCIPDLACHITNDASSTRVHACMNKMDRKGLACDHNVSQENILTIVPSTLKWRGKNASVIKEWDNARENTLNVCYSMHASFDELKAFIQYFRPKGLYPCVNPIGIELNDIPNFIHQVQNEISKKIKEEEEEVNSDRNREKYTLNLDDEDVVEPWTKYYFANNDDER